jgi:NADH dehydrogenase FAD-containing subunit
MHSQSYRDNNSFANKRIVVVGMGNSGVDTAVDLSRVAKTVFQLMFYIDPGYVCGSLVIIDSSHQEIKASSYLLKRKVIFRSALASSPLTLYLSQLK